MKKIISTLLAMVMLLGAVAALGLTVSAETEAIAISNADELLAIAAQFDDGNFKGDYYLANDIDFGGKAFSQYVFKHFNGTLDGKGHKIYNFSFDGSNTNANAGFFSWFGNSADVTVKNLQIGDATTPIVYNFNVEKSSKNYSFFVAESGNNNAETSVTIENVNIYGVANVTTKIADPKFNFGGLIGMTRSKTNAYVIKDCTINGEINVCTALTGGGNYVNGAGFIGSQNSKTSFVMENCVNNANVTTGFSTKEARAAGFIAYTAQKAITLKDCVNTGKITVLGDTAGAEVAGFVCDINGAGAELINCINAGEISGCLYVGGLIAKIRDGKTATLTDCANYGKISAAEVAAPAVAFGAAAATVTNFSDKTGTAYPEVTEPETTEPPVVTEPETTEPPVVTEPETTEPPVSGETGDNAILFIALTALSVLGVVIVSKKREN